MVVYYVFINDGSEPDEPNHRSELLERLDLDGVVERFVEYCIKVLCCSVFGNELEVFGLVSYLVEWWLS